jgi:putative endonuclease
MWFVYLLRCSDDSIYCGITNNLDRRIKAHSNGKGAKFTRSRLPILLIYLEERENRSEALKREYEIKKMSKKDKIILTKNFLDSSKQLCHYTKL